MPRVFAYIVLLFFWINLQSCSKKNTCAQITDNTIQIPIGFPSFDFPEGNEYSPDRWELGKRLFYEPLLSANNRISCGSCHLASFAFSDTLAFSFGSENAIGTSNAPPLFNLAYLPYYTRAGGVPTLEMQILVPIQEHNEFNANIVDIVEELKMDSSYSMQALKAYNRSLDPFVITRAIANFERSLISGNSAFDQYYFQGKSSALTESEKHGMELFYNAKTNCSQCHSGFNFTNNSFENNGLYLNYLDSGRMRLTHLESDRARYKVPSLRNVKFTGPYMHDGSMKTLEEVIEHYNSGGKNHANKSELIKPLLLSKEEMKDLQSFLESLSDYQFINNTKFRK